MSSVMDNHSCMNLLVLTHASLLHCYVSLYKRGSPLGSISEISTGLVIPEVPIYRCNNPCYPVSVHSIRLVTRLALTHRFTAKLSPLPRVSFLRNRFSR